MSLKNIIVTMIKTNRFFASLRISNINKRAYPPSIFIYNYKYVGNTNYLWLLKILYCLKKIRNIKYIIKLLNNENNSFSLLSTLKLYYIYFRLELLIIIIIIWLYFIEYTTCYQKLYFTHRTLIWRKIMS